MIDDSIAFRFKHPALIHSLILPVLVIVPVFSGASSVLYVVLRGYDVKSR